MLFRSIQWKRWRRAGSPVSAEPFRGFESWADELWNRARTLHSLCMARDAAVLNCLYPPDDRCRFVRVRYGSSIGGWAAILVSEMRGNPYFGNMRLGTILDGLALPECIAPTVRAAAAALEDMGVDLVVSNQSDARWISALRDAGFIPGPSNYALSLSPSLVERIPDFARQQAHIHVTRGDGDGRVRL